MRFEDFLQIVRQQEGPPGLGQRTWADVARLFERHKARIMEEMERIAASFIVPVGPDASRIDFESWTENKRRAANLAAVLALANAEIRGSATDEERHQICCYTGFGGFREIGVLPEGYPAEYIQASREFAQATARGDQPPDFALDIIGRVKDQYFTAMDACRVGWELVKRAHGGVPATVLEPSAGIGRFALTAPPGASFQLVEFDPMMARMLAMIYPQHEVHSGPFESWVKTQTEPVFDAVIGNPPWPKRMAHLRAMDVPDIADNVDYFMLRGASVLRPGGTLALLIPASFLLGSTHRDARARLFRSCAFRGAALLPSETYPTVREGTFTFVVVTRRRAAAKKLTEREERVIAGDFLDLPESETSTLGGEWARGTRGRRDGDPNSGAIFLKGHLQSERVHSVVISAAEEVEDKPAKVPKSPKTPKAAGPKAEPPAIVRVQTPQDAELDTARQTAREEAEKALGERVRAWVRRVNANPDEAERERKSLLETVSLFLADHGVPRNPAVRAVLDGDVPSRLLLTPVRGAAKIAPPSHSNIEQAVAWFCDRKGFAVAKDLEDFGDDDLQIAQNAARAGLYLTVAAEGIKVYTRPFYLHGSATQRLLEIERASSVEDPTVRGRLESQKQEVLNLWQRKLLPDIDFNQRSSFVPLQVVQDWINDQARTENPKDYNQVSRWSWREENPQGDLPDEETLSSFPLIRLAIAFQQVQVIEGCPWTKYQKMFPKTADLLKWLIGYMNRTSMVENEDGSRSRANVSDAELAIKVDNENEQNFRDWVGQSKWAQSIEDEYNRLTSDINVELPTTPMELPGQSPAISLRPHQNQAVRMACMSGRARSVLLALDVGAGKTICGLATAMKWKADGLARRTLIVVPPSVLAKWYDDGSKLFPNARIGVIGMSRKAKGEGFVPDPAPVRLAKWLAFGAGAYDLCIVGHKAFWRDLEPNEQDAKDLVSNLAWAKRKAGEAVLEAKRLLKVKESHESSLPAAQDELAREEGWYAKATAEGRDYNTTDLDKAQRKVATIQRTIAGIEEKLAELPSPTDSEATAVAEWVRSAVSDKPYRPQVKEGTLVDDDSVDIDIEVDEDELEEDETNDDDSKPERSEKGPKVEVRKVPVPGLVSWDEIGVDSLIVDEFHNFRSTFFPSERGKKIEYCGRPEDKKTMMSTARAWDMCIKCRSVTRLHGGAGGVEGLTATPINNSLLELFNLVDMIAPALWTDHGIRHKEEFIDRYWDIQPGEVVKPGKGDRVMAPVLKGIKSNTKPELLSILAPVFMRKTTKELMAAGWIRNVPTTDSKPIFVKRDPAQVVLLRTLTALLIKLTEKKEDKDKSKKIDEDGNPVPDSKQVLTEEEKRAATQMWRLRDGVPVPVGQAPEWEAAFGKDFEKSRKMASIFRLAWMAMLDKVAMDPRLLLGIKPRIEEESQKYEKKLAAFREWERKKAAGEKVSKNPPSVPEGTKVATAHITLAILRYLDLENALSIYEKGRSEFCPKVLEMATYIARNLDRPSGKCGHVIFCDWVDMHDQIEQALVKIAGIPKNRIGRITGATAVPKRLIVSRALNGIDEWGQDVKATLDVVIGTDKAMAEGIDLQRRSCGVHHLTMPWEPSTVHQRNGRAVRQGNLVGEVDLRYYMTENSYDALRFDKVQAKASWMDTVFSGTQDTSNPAIGAELDPNEIILTMVIEDEAVLKERLDKLRAAREEGKRAKLIEEVRTEWLKVNSYFQSARRQPDATTRAAQEHQARQRLDRLLMRWSVPEAAAQRVVDQVVYYDPLTEDVVAEGDCVLSNSYDEKGKLTSSMTMRVLKHEVRGVSWLHWGRARGSYVSTPLFNPETRNLEGKRPEPWSDEEEIASLSRSLQGGIMPRDFGSLASDLQPHAQRLWRVLIASSRVLSPRFDWFIHAPVVHPQAVLVPGLLPEGGHTNYDVAPITVNLREQTHSFIPHTAPDAFELWCAAVSQGQLYLGERKSAVSYGYSLPTYQMPKTPYRGSSMTEDEKMVRALTRQVMLRALPTEVWRLRQANLWRSAEAQAASAPAAP